MFGTVLTFVGIDVQAELRQKGGPSIGAPRPSHSSGSQRSPMQRALMNRQHYNRRTHSGPPPLQPVGSLLLSNRDGVYSNPPYQQHTSSSQSSSPSTSRSPAFITQGGISSPTADFAAQQPPQHTSRPMLPPQHSSYLGPGQPETAAPGPSGGAPRLMSPNRQRAQAQYYPASFQKHYDQLGKLSRFLFPSCFSGALFVLG